jgi:hypothetical protein
MALLKNIMMRGVQTLERRIVNRLWTDRRYPLNMNINPEIRAPVELTLRSLRRR